MLVLLAFRVLQAPPGQRRSYRLVQEMQGNVLVRRPGLQVLEFRGSNIPKVSMTAMAKPSYRNRCLCLECGALFIVHERGQECPACKRARQRASLIRPRKARTTTPARCKKNSEDPGVLLARIKEVMGDRWFSSKHLAKALGHANGRAYGRSLVRLAGAGLLEVDRRVAWRTRYRIIPKDVR